ncbi:MAG: hydrogenase maturation protease [Betaproteobacteria bacterium]|nr:hydrogenase maturation protease [Betaproteobacteria bacterium]
MAEAPLPDAGTVVIGVGNAMQGDDAVGLVVARALVDRAGVPVEEHDGEAAGLIDLLRGRTVAIIVDAVRGPAPGDVRRLDVSDAPLPAGWSPFSSHGFGVAEAVELARALGVLPRLCVIYGVGGAAFATGESLSPPVRAAVPAVTARVVDEVREILNAGRGVLHA